MEFLFLLVPIVVIGLVYRHLTERVDRLVSDVEALRGELAALRSGNGVAGPAGEELAEEEGLEAFPPEQPAIGTAEPPPLPPAKPEATEEAVAARAAQGKGGWSGLDLESLLGGRWSVILGGIAVALGALFLVRYSIETGLLGPSARIAAGGLFAAALLGSGEYLRRKDRLDHLPPFMMADVPGILTGAGAVAAFGTLYAAHAIYGFIGPGAAFLALTVIGLACLVLASLHGPKLAAIGLLGAFAAPILVDSDASDMPALVLHVLIVTASVMSAARIRGWRWLAIGGVVGSLLWALLAIVSAGHDEQVLSAVLAVGLAVIYAAGFAWPFPDRGVADSAEGRDWAGIGAFVALAFVAALAVAVLDAPLSVVTAALVGLIFIFTAVCASRLAPVAPWTALVTTVLGFTLELPGSVEPGLFDDRLLQGLPVPPDISAYLAAFLGGAVPVVAAALYAAWRSGHGAPRLAGQSAIAAALVTVLGLATAYLRVGDWETSLATGIAGLVLAFGAVALTEAFTRMRPGDWSAPAPAAFAVAAVALVAIAMGAVLTRTWLPFGMALTSAGIAWINGSRPFRAMPVLAVILAALAFSGIYFNVPFDLAEIGRTPFLNRLVLIAGLPAVALIVGGEWLRRDGAGLWATLQTAIGLALLALFVALELRHFIAGGHIVHSRFGLADMAVQSIAALGFAIGLQFAARFTRARVYDGASLVAGIIGIAMLIGGLGLRFNPLFSWESVGEGRVFNLLLPAYLVTGLLAGAVTVLSAGLRPGWYRLGYGIAAGLLLFLYATLMVRHGFQGERLGFYLSTGDAEFWTYSAVWLLLGAALLAVGLVVASLPLRVASALLIVLTIGKVFLFDMSALTGALRAFSFIGLGILLLVIGRFYQRLLLRRSPPAEGGPAPA